MKVSGHDPGFSGAAAVFGHPSGGASNWPRILDVYDMRTTGEGASKRIDILHFRDWLREHKPDRGYIELASSMRAPVGPDGSRAKMHEGYIGRYMRGAGHLEATVICCDIETRLVQPVVWKRFFGLTGPDKANSIAVALELCPETTRWIKLKKHHNRAEAILIALYGAVRAEMVELRPALEG